MKSGNNKDINSLIYAAIISTVILILSPLLAVIINAISSGYRNNGLIDYYKEEDFFKFYVKTAYEGKATLLQEIENRKDYLYEQTTYRKNEIEKVSKEENNTLIYEKLKNIISNSTFRSEEYLPVDGYDYKDDYVRFGFYLSKDLFTHQRYYLHIYQIDIFATTFIYSDYIDVCFFSRNNFSSSIHYYYDHNQIDDFTVLTSNFNTLNGDRYE